MLVSGAYLLVDGYNVINSSKDFDQLKVDDLAHARDLFADMLANYSAFRGCISVLVFDAYARVGPATVEEYSGVQVVFTSEGETADSYIERAAYDFLRKNNKVFVVTGDHSEQLMILGMGAYRLTAGELLADYRKVCKDIEERVTGGRPLSGRQEIAGRIKGEVLCVLEDLRRESRR